MICELEGCKKKAKRRFCSTKHKYRYHNLHNPRGKFAHLANIGQVTSYGKRIVEVEVFSNEEYFDSKD